MLFIFACINDALEYLFSRQLLNQVDGRRASKLKIHVTLLQNDQPLVHLVQQVDILDDQIRHLAAYSHDVGDKKAQSCDEDEAARHYLKDGEQTRDRPRATLKAVYEWKDNKLVYRDCNSARDGTLSCFADAEEVEEYVLLKNH